MTTAMKIGLAVKGALCMLAVAAVLMAAGTIGGLVALHRQPQVQVVQAIPAPGSHPPGYPFTSAYPWLPGSFTLIFDNKAYSCTATPNPYEVIPVINCPVP